MKKNLCKYFLPAVLVVGISGGIAGFQVSQVFSHEDLSDTKVSSTSNDKNKELLSDGKDDRRRPPGPLMPEPII